MFPCQEIISPKSEKKKIKIPPSCFWKCGNHGKQGISEKSCSFYIYIYYCKRKRRPLSSVSFIYFHLFHICTDAIAVCAQDNGVEQTLQWSPPHSSTGDFLLPQVMSPVNGVIVLYFMESDNSRFTSLMRHFITVCTALQWKVVIYSLASKCNALWKPLCLYVILESVQELGLHQHNCTVI